MRVVSILLPSISTLSRDNTVFIGFIGPILPYILSFMDKSEKQANVLLGRRIRSLRNARGMTQQELGNQAEINYKFIGEIERGQQNPSFRTLVKIATALDIDFPDLFRYENEIQDRKTIEARIVKIIKNIPDETLRQIHAVLQTLYPTK